MELTVFLHAVTNLCKLKGAWKCLGCIWSKMRVTSLVADSKIDCIWRMSRCNNWFFVCWYRFTKIKSWSEMFWFGMIRNRCGHTAEGFLKLTLSQIWTDGINWFFACWSKFRKTKSLLNDFGWVWPKTDRPFKICFIWRINWWI